jgi:hypothetical protein
MRKTDAIINLEVLFDKFTTHILSCKSADFVLDRHASFESWFRVELAEVLRQFGYSGDQIQTNYKYPDSDDKADLCVRADGDIVFELKPFVKGQDSNKYEKYPEQIKKLERTVESRHCQQVIAITTFIGYTSEQMQEYMQHFFGNGKWQILEPRRVSEEHELRLALCTVIK